MTTVKGLHNMDPLSINVDKYCPMVSWTFPRSRIADFTIALSGIGRRHRLAIPSFGHAGDGSIHVNIMYIGKDETKKAHQALQEILKLTLGLKGTLSGEHWVGISKKPYIGMEIAPTALGLMRKIKKAFDPNGILNPGKIFEEA